MAGYLDQAEANRLLAAMLGQTTYPATTLPVNGRLMTAMGSASANGTEVANSGGSTYSAQPFVPSGNGGTPTPSQPTAGAINNSAGSITYANMPACTVVGIELWDSNSTPRRKMAGPLTASKTCALGDSLVFATSQLAASLA